MSDSTPETSSLSENTSLRPVFVLSPGRSGSTLLQRCLNLAEELIIWGEHGGFLSDLAETYYKHARDQKTQDLLAWGRAHAPYLLKRESPVEAGIQWTNSFRPEDWRSAFRDMLLGLFTIEVPPSLRWGFKEIRYGVQEIRVLKDLFPESQFLFLIRHPIDTLASVLGAWFYPAVAWQEQPWRQDPAIRTALQEFLARHCARMFKVGTGIMEFASEGLLLRYEDLIRDPHKILSEICRFLGIAPIPAHRIADMTQASPTRSAAEDIRALLSEDPFREVVRPMCELYYAGFSYIEQQASAT